MSLIRKLANKYKPNQSASSRSSRDVGDSVLMKEDHRITNATGTLIEFILLGLICLFGYSDTHATSSSLTVSVTSGADAFINIPPTSEGKFGSAGPTTFSITTNHASGYTLTAGATNLSFTDTTPDPDVTYTIDNLPANTSISPTVFESNSDYKNKWGYQPSKYYNGTTTVANNTNYFPAPIGTSQTLDITSAANPSTANTYDITIGTKLDHTIALGSYATTITLTAVANPTPYTITYVAKDGSSGTNTTNMPTTNPQTGSVDGDTATLSSKVPLRNGYDFKGWCTAQTAADATCTGTKYTINSTYNLDQTTINSLTLYAMWKSNNCNPNGTSIPSDINNPGANDIVCMQDINEDNKASILSSMAEDAQYQLKDRRDDKTYWVSKLKDGNIWMTQNLDLNLEALTTLTSYDTDLPDHSLTGAYQQGYTYDTDSVTPIVTWTPSRNTINAVTDATTKINSISGWETSSVLPSSVDAGDWYWDGSSDYVSSLCNGSGTYQDCNYMSKQISTYADYFSTTPYAFSGFHGHVGNYYNWSVAIASNDSNAYSVSTYGDPSNNPQNSLCPASWRLPIITAYTASEIGNNDFHNLNHYYNNGRSGSDAGLITGPIYSIRSGNIGAATLSMSGYRGNYWSSTLIDDTKAHALSFGSGWVSSTGAYYRQEGLPLRCLVR